MERDILAQRRVYLGNIIGNKILSDYNKIALAVEDNTFNNLLAGSIESAFLATTGGRFQHISLTKDTVDMAVSKIASYSPEALIFILGGESPDDTSYILSTLLSKLFVAECHSDLLFDAVHLKKDTLEKSLSNENALKFLEENNTYAVTIDPEEGIVILNEVIINKDTKIELYTLSEYPITFDHGKLLKNSS